jgi:DNA-binding NtrC family response regulator
MISINVAGLDESMFSDTLFGHAKGAFTGAQQSRDGLIRKAEHGTLFLDEIGDLDPSSQIKLLRLLQEKEYYPVGSDHLQQTNARFIMATHVPLAEKVKAGIFREDLYYRLMNHRIHLPALRERAEDIPLLAQSMNKKMSEDLGRAVFPIPPHVIEKWIDDSFSGNIRELEGRVRHGILFGFDKPMEQAIVVEPITKTSVQEFSVQNPDGSFPTIKEMTERLVIEVMEASNHRQVEAAKLLGISQQALSSRLKKMKGS